MTVTKTLYTSLGDDMSREQFYAGWVAGHESIWSEEECPVDAVPEFRAGWTKGRTDTIIDEGPEVLDAPRTILVTGSSVSCPKTCSGQPRVPRERNHSGDPMTLFTIGYQGATLEPFIRTLEAHQVEILVDVRALPRSRKPGFSKTALDSALGQRGIDYMHLPGLGNPGPGRDAARAGDYDNFARIYRAHMGTLEAQIGLFLLLGAIAHQRTCLMCFERAAEQCHRSLIADWMRRSGYTVCDLVVDAPDHGPMTGCWNSG